MQVDRKQFREALKKVEGLYYQAAVVIMELRDIIEKGAEQDPGASSEGSADRISKPRLKRRVFDRHEWGRTTAYRLVPKFDSTEFSRAYLENVPQEFRHIFDAARIKKILNKLCTDGHIALVRKGGGRKPAIYRIKGKPPRARARD